MKLTNNLRSKYLNIFLFLFFFFSLKAQQVDLLESAKELSRQKEFTKVSQLLSTYYPTHQDELYTSWLYAASLYEIGEMDRAQYIYQRAIDNYPNNYELIVDYATKLMYGGDLKKAKWFFGQINKTSIDYEFIVEKNRALIGYWSGAYDEAFEHINRAIEIYPTDKSVTRIKNNITVARRNWLSIELGYFTDDQPLNKIVPKLTAGYYVDQNLSVGIRVDFPYFTQDKNNYNSQWFQGFAKYQFLKYGMSLQLDAGVIRLPSTAKEWTGKLSYDYKIWKHLDLVVYAGRQPYLSTISSLYENLLSYQYGVSLGWNNPKGFLGKIAWDINNFSSLNNVIQTQSAWLVSPSMKAGRMDMRIGYGVNYSNTIRNNFESTLSLDDILMDWDTSTVINGVYKPFFTPNNQLVHSAIAMFTFHPISFIDIGINANYGFYAKADTPYLYLNREIGEEETTIDRLFFNKEYHPMDLEVYLSYNFNNNVTIKANYKYQKTNYYESHFSGLTTNILF